MHNIMIAMFVLLAAYGIFYVIIFSLEDIKQKRNPIKKAINHDKRFNEIKNYSLHEIYKVNRGN